MSFLPVFVWDGEAGRIFKPLPFSKTFAMSAAALLAMTIIPVLMYASSPGAYSRNDGVCGRAPIITLGAMLLPAAALFIIASGSRIWRIPAGGSGAAGAMLTAMLLRPEGDSLNRPMPSRVGSPRLCFRGDERISNTPGSARACGGVLVAHVVLLPDRARVPLFKRPD